MATAAIGGRSARATNTVKISSVRLAALLIFAFTTGLATCSAFFLFWLHQSDTLVSTSRSTEYNGVAPPEKTNGLRAKQPLVPEVSTKNVGVIQVQSDSSLPTTSHLMAQHNENAPTKKKDGQHAKQTLVLDASTKNVGNIQAKHVVTAATPSSAVVVADDLASCRSTRGPQIRSAINCCKSSIQNPPDKIDIVIPYEYREETDVSLKYELRSFEKSGLLEHVGTVFIIADTRNNARLIRARYQKYIAKMTNGEGGIITQLRVIAMDEIEVPFDVRYFEGDPKLGKPHYSPYLPQISEYFLLVPDDIVMLRKYTRDIWFDSKKSLPYGHGFGSWKGSETHGYPNIAEMHGVNFLNRCSMRYVIEKYNVKKPADLSPIAVALGMMKEQKLLAGFYGYHSGAFRNVGPHKAHFFMECHTNGGCRKPNFDDIFVNIQGDGVSIEYRKASAKTEQMWKNWFERTFPVPSRFE